MKMDEVGAVHRKKILFFGEYIVQLGECYACACMGGRFNAYFFLN